MDSLRMHANSRSLCQRSRGLTQKHFCKDMQWSWGYSSVAKYVFYMFEALTSILNTGK